MTSVRTPRADGHPPDWLSLYEPPCRSSRTSNSDPRFLMVIEQDEDGMYVATVPSLRGCHTQARTIEELIPCAREAIELCLEVEDLNEPSMRFVGVQEIELAA